MDCRGQADGFTPPAGPQGPASQAAKQARPLRTGQGGGDPGDYVGEGGLAGHGAPPVHEDGVAESLDGGHAGSPGGGVG